jgi:hypothetical protein
VLDAVGLHGLLEEPVVGDVALPGEHDEGLAGLAEQPVQADGQRLIGRKVGRAGQENAS